MVISMDRWVGKVAIVTGASGGIGEAIAKALVTAGLKVVGMARRVEKVEALSKQLQGKSGKLYAVKGDVTKEEDILKLFHWTKNNLGPIHILINNAGVVRYANLINIETKFIKDVLDTNVFGLTIATREAVKDMQANKIDGHIIHINSVVGHSIPNLPQMNVYPASKYAVTALTETLRRELVSLDSKIKITSVSPGYVHTEIVQAGFAAGGTKVDMEGMYNTLAALEADDIADAVLYALATPPHVQVVGVARRVERVEALSKQLQGTKGKLYAIRGDITREEDILEVFNWTKTNLGPVHILINKAGILRFANLFEIETKFIKEVLDTNVLGLTIATRKAVTNMRSNKIDGHIVHINSVSGYIVPNLPKRNVYPASKHAVTALTETLRQELNSIGSKIKITSVSPGFVCTEIMQSSQDVRGTKIDMVEMLHNMAALHADDVADAVLYALATPPHVQVHELTIKPVGETF